MSLWGLFTSAFISSTIAPGGSEAVLVWLILQSTIPTWLLVATATVGNTLGASTTWLLGKIISNSYTFKGRMKPPSEYAMTKIKKWGPPALLLSWLPVIGDALCFAGGWMQLPLIKSFIAILIGKFLRYLAIAYAFL